MGNDIYKDVPLTAYIIYYWKTTPIKDQVVTALWFDWAKQLLAHGYSSPEIITLSKNENTYDQLQLKGLTNVILDSLPIDLNDVETIVINHVSYIIQTNEKNGVPVLDTLQNIVGISIEFPLECLKDFILLYHGYKEIREYGEQSFWEGLTLENKDRYIKNYFQKWINNPQCIRPKEFEKQLALVNIHPLYTILFITVLTIIILGIINWVCYDFFKVKIYHLIFFDLIFLISLIPIIKDKFHL